jgi:hypothetical protein
MISEVPDIVTETFAPLLEARGIAFEWPRNERSIG